MSAVAVEPSRLRTWLLGRLASAVGVKPAAIDPDAPFSSFGLDSAKVVELSGDLQAFIGRPIDPTVLFEHPSVSALVAHLTDDRQVARPATTTTARPAAGRPTDVQIGIVGIACRFPGADGPEAVWRLLEGGVDAVGEMPAERWNGPSLYDPDPATPGRSNSKWGGFVKDVDGFDAALFRIGDDEAVRMDPQQRLLLETCWAALEDAGALPGRLRGSRTGVYVGISTNDYSRNQFQDVVGIGPYTATGSSFAVAANRLSYAFDLHGPSVAVDTACSSSLVALHLASGALRAGECDLAVVAGVNLLLDPAITVALSKAGMLAPDGRCKPFDAGANGYVRGEGCGVVVLRPLTAARAAGDRVYALVKGTAVNQDGASNGLTAPSPAAQRAVVQAACAQAGVEPSEIQYVECHGTGTLLGDPIEARSLGAVVGAGRPAGRPCLIGSVKSNIGHLEAAAGIAGLIKVALSISHGALPPSLHYEKPNPHIPFGELGLEVVTRTRPWPASEPLAGVSSFGFGGTNAHVVLSGAPVVRSSTPVDGPLALAVSARSEEGLRAQLQAWASRLAEAGDAEVASLAYTACMRRTHHRSHRAAFAAPDGRSLVERVREAAGRQAPSGGQTAGVPVPGLGMVFSGQGSTWIGMGRSLLASEPLFRSTIRRCDEAAAPELGWSLEAALRGDDERDLRDTAVAQTLIVAVQLGLVELCRSFGCEPAAVAGHSVGEISAAVAAGMLDLADGMRLACLRGRLMGSLAPAGRMLAVGLDRDEASDRAARAGVAVAALNGPRSAVLAGDGGALDRVRRELAESGVFASWLDVEYAFHSPDMEAAAAALAEQLPALIVREPEIPMYSTVLGRKVTAADLDGAYWSRGLRQPVDLERAVRALVADGVQAILEVGPRPVLRSALREIVKAAEGGAPRLLHLVDRERDDSLAVLDTVCRLYEAGFPVRWDAVFPDGGRVASAPTHHFDRRRFWMRPAQGAGPAAAVAGDPLLGTRLDLAQAQGGAVWEAGLGIDTMPTLADHRMGGTVLAPAALFAEVAAAAGRHEGIEGPVAVTGLQIHRPLPLGRDRVRLQVTLAPAGGGRFDVTVHTRAAGPAAAGRWSLVASAGVAALGDPRPPAEDLDARTSAWQELDGAALYDLLGSAGLDYGPSFRIVERARRGSGQAVAALRQVDSAGSPGSEDLRKLDGALHAIAAAIGRREGGPGIDGPLLPVGAEAYRRWTADLGQVTSAWARVRDVVAGRLLADVALLDASGAVCAEVVGLHMRAAATAPKRAAASLPLHLYQPEWVEQAPAGAPPVLEGRWLVLDDGGEVARGLAAGLSERGATVLWCATGDAYAHPSDDRWVVDPDDRGQLKRLVADVTKGGPLAGVVHLWGLRAPAGSRIAERDLRPAASLLDLVQDLSFSGQGRLPRLVVGTASCHHVVEGDAAARPDGAVLWGLLKTLPFENALLPFLCVDLEGVDAAAGGRLAAEIALGVGEAEVAHRPGRRFIRRLRAAELGEAPVTLQPRQDAAYVITGGTGALGLLFARRLVERGARHVVLVARRAPSARAEKAIEALRAQGAEVTVAIADVRDRDQLEAAIQSARASGHPIRGVAHAAGTLADGPMLDMTRDALRTVLEPKVAGARHLHDLTLDDPLEWFVLFSSAASLLGSPGQANYSAANAYLDALAHHRRASGRPAISVDWGPWADLGMAEEIGKAGVNSAQMAVRMIPPEVGLDAIELLGAGSLTHVMALPIDLRDLLQFYPGGPGKRFFEDLETEDRRILKSIEVKASTRPDLATPYVAPRNGIEQQVAEIWQRSLGVESVGVNDSFFELGGDSVFGNQILVEIARVLGVKLEAERVFDDFTVAGLARLVDEDFERRLEEMSDEEAARLLQETAEVPAGDQPH